MNTRLFATAAAVASFAVTSTAFAQDATIATDPATPVTPPAQMQPQMQPQPVMQQPATVGTMPAASPPVTPGTQAAVAQPQPVSTTTTTQAAYGTSSDSITEETRRKGPNRPLLITGSSLFLLSYGASVAVAAQSDRDADNRLYIPVVGPWLDLGQRNCDAQPCGDSEGVAKGFIIASGAAQGAGVLMALSSFIFPEKERVQVRQSAALKPEVKVLPVSFVGGGGLGAVGRF